MNTTGYRVTYTILALLLLVIVALSLIFIPSGDPQQLPDAVERYSPHDGDIAINPVKVMIDMEERYEVVFVIDGITIPKSDVDSIIEIGRYQFEPGEGKIIERWSPGEHTVVATWIGGVSGTDAGALLWRFRVQ